MAPKWWTSGPPSKRAPAPLARMRSGSDFRGTNSTELVGNNTEMVVPALYIWIECKNVQGIINILNEVGKIRQLLERWRKEKSVREEGEDYNW